MVDAAWEQQQRVRVASERLRDELSVLLGRPIGSHEITLESAADVVGVIGDLRDQVSDLRGQVSEIVEVLQSRGAS